MATRTVNLRLPEDLVEYLKRNNDSINQAVISEINTLKRIRTVALGELKGIFTPRNGYSLQTFLIASVWKMSFGQT